MEAVPEFPFSLSLCEPRENERDVRGPLTRSVFRQSARATATPDGSQIGVQARSRRGNDATLREKNPGR